MLLPELLASKNIILASNSPRRKEYLQQLGLVFETKPTNADESYPDDFLASEITDHIALQKALAAGALKATDLLIASDTIVWHQNQALGKPNNEEEAVAILSSLSGKTHEVISSVCLRTAEKTVVFNDITAVSFKALTLEEIQFYVANYQPYDKAGAYGIQEWIGLIGIEKIEGSYTNVVGLPMEKLYQQLILFVS
ncbi:Maf family nucleotide pyrophosphatase [Flavobacterium sp. NKUCC04_CG]|uniref:Maf family nucleotide pyrophosphatase n=1 Tax=Flavobacterium sp. NKUCC04_CG TaxID=2842121 RepID=UPI001C5A67FF|nr:Maf family nucleotide pyrophosphatase [Flavobacterium sp. NKUCC04_CG]MBW3517983.1 septum formation protein Maf [Flavobacterium sp. NKUCC04_CG]